MSEERKPRLVRCPKPFEPLFVAAEDAMADFFSDLQRRPEKGEITISGVRYLLVRAASMSIQFRNELSSLYGQRTANPAAGPGDDHGTSAEIHAPLLFALRDSVGASSRWMSTKRYDSSRCGLRNLFTRFVRSSPTDSRPFSGIG